MNSALDATELVAKLRSAHSIAQRKETAQEVKDENRYFGMDLKGGQVRNNLKVGVLKPVISKMKSLSFAVEACITILRIDDFIMLNPEKKEGK